MSDARQDERAAISRANTVRALLQQLVRQLEASPALASSGEDNTLDREAREIVATLLGVTPGAVSRSADQSISSDVVSRALDIANRRAGGEPLAYALGTAWFRHLELVVDRRVLIPRPETEVVVDHALRLALKDSGGIAVDIGTGSGAIALSLATEGTFDRVIATDISADALAVARLNATRVLDTAIANAAGANTRKPADIDFRLGRDFEPLAGIKAQMVVSNPPYIAHDEAAFLPSSVRDWEPALALFADEGGMARYDALLAHAPSHLVPGGWLVLEVDSRRGYETARRATACGRYEAVELKRDLSNRDRVLLARLRGDIISD